MKADRHKRSAVREERLKSSAVSCNIGVSALSVWRGKSGKRYVVHVTSIDETDLVAARGAVVIAICRGAGGCADIIARRACDPGDGGFLGWLAACATRGANELHTHRLAATQEQRRIIVEDLTDLPSGIA